MNKLFKIGPSKYLPHVEIDQCTGCGDCIKACGPNCLDIIANVAVLTDPQNCGSDAHCVHACPHNAIHMDWLPYSGAKTVGEFSRVQLIMTKGPFIEFR